MFTTARFALISALVMTPMAVHAAQTEHVVTGEDGVPHLRVSYAGLDLTKPADRAEMAHRIDHAATRVCESQRVHSIEASQSIAYQTCRRTVIAQARAGVGL